MTVSVAIALIIVVVGALSFLGYQLIDYQRQRKDDIADYKNAKKRADEQPEKTKPAWDLARVTLESYFNKNLSQINIIFYVSVVLMTFGFIIIILGFILASQSQSSLISAAITTGAGVITEFIGATFLLVYRSTIDQALIYTKMLERINTVGMAMQILDTMSDEPSSIGIKLSTKAKIVELLVTQGHTGISSPENSPQKP